MLKPPKKLEKGIKTIIRPFVILFTLATKSFEMLILQMFGIDDNEVVGNSAQRLYMYNF